MIILELLLYFWIGLNIILLYGYYTHESFKEYEISIKAFWEDIDTIGNLLFLVLFSPSIVMHNVLNIKIRR